MPVERQAWTDAQAWPAANPRLARAFDVFDASDRYVTQALTATKAVALASPLTLLDCDTSAGAVALTLPSAAAHVGYRVDVSKTAGANALTVNGTAVTTAAAWISTGALWRAV